MRAIAEFSQSATFAWSHDKLPLIATGAYSGNLDDQSDENLSLEIRSLASIDNEKPEASLKVQSKFNDIDWSIKNDLIVGAMEDASVQIFKYDKESTSITNEATIKKTTSPIKTIRFNSIQPNALLTGNSVGKIQIWDIGRCLKNVDAYEPLNPGEPLIKSASNEFEISSLAWNRCIAHVFASAMSTTHASIWDLKAKKEVVHLNYTSPKTGIKSQIHAVEWSPTVSTKLATSSYSSSDNESVILLWDLRNSKAPYSILNGGENQPYSSIDWCLQDDDMILTNCLDSTVVLWNANTKQKIATYANSGRDSFKSKFAPEFPELFATASISSKLQIQPIQNFNNDTNALNVNEITNDFEGKSESDFWNNVTSNSSSTDSQNCIIHDGSYVPRWYSNASAMARWSVGGKLVSITKDHLGVIIEQKLSEGPSLNVELFEDALSKNNYDAVINKRLAKSIDTNNEDDWTLIEKLSLDGKNTVIDEFLSYDDELEEKTNLDQDEDFFNELEMKYSPSGEFQISESAHENIAKLLTLHKNDEAIRMCLDENLLSEAMLLTIDCNDESLKTKVKNAFFRKNGDSNPLVRFIYSTETQESEDLIENLDISQWQLTARSIMNNTKGDVERKNSLLTKLADKLNDANFRQEASVLYLAADNFNKILSAWILESSDLEEKISSTDEKNRDAHTACLVEFFERVSAFTSSIGIQNLPNNYELLNQKIIEFVHLCLNSGSAEVAEKLLRLSSDNKVLSTEFKDIFSKFEKVKPVDTISHAQTVAESSNDKQREGISQTKLNSTNPYQPNTNPKTSVNTFSRQASTTSVGKISSYAPQKMDKPTIPRVSHGSTSNNQKKNSTTILSFPQTTFAKPTATFISEPVPANENGEASLENLPVDAIQSGQQPNSNKKANSGWNDLPINLEKKFVRAKPVSIAASPVLTSSAASMNFNAKGATSRIDSRNHSITSMTMMAPPPHRGTRKSSVVSVTSHFNTPSMNSKIPASPSIALPPSKSLSVYSFRSQNKSLQGDVDQERSLSNSPRMVSINSANGFINPQTMNVSTSVPATVSNPYAPSIQDATPHALKSHISTPKIGSIPEKNVSYLPSNVTNGIPSKTATGYLPPQQSVPSFAQPPQTNGQISSKLPPPIIGKRKSNNQLQTDKAMVALPENLQQVNLEAMPPVPNLKTNGTANKPISGSTQTAAIQQDMGPAITELQSDSSEEKEFIILHFRQELERVAPLIPKEYNKQLKDCHKRINILFDHFAKNELITAPTIKKLYEISLQLNGKNYQDALQLQKEIAAAHAEEAGNWLTGVKRLIAISQATAD